MSDRELIKRMRLNGIVHPEATLTEARRTGLPLTIACAALEQESGGGHNVFGNDNVPNPVKRGPVTKERYLEYKRHRMLGKGANGVGPMQLTWSGYQDRADQLGGCWVPEINMRVGFSILRSNIRTSGLRAGVRKYNGSGAAAERYADQVLRRISKWRNVLAGADGGGGTRPPQPTGPYAADFLALCLKQKGDRYRFGAEVKFTDPDPDVFDCSELIEWALARMNVRFPDGSWNQEKYCRDRSTIIPFARAVRIQGALLFRHRGKDGHVAVSLGNGSTIEARGRAYGVNTFQTARRVWTAAALVPGLKYEPPADNFPRWPGRFLTQPPQMRGRDVQVWQRRMLARGWRIPTNGVYGPNTELVCRRFQQEKGLLVDGIVGHDTWRAAWLAPLTP
jgi:cell wall-associated NlpC family hydrolase